MSTEDDTLASVKQQQKTEEGSKESETKEEIPFSESPITQVNTHANDAPITGL
mgnify:CR=1 FL=1